MQMQVLIKELKVEYIDDVTELFRNLVKDISDETGDPYFQFDTWQPGKIINMLQGIIEDDCSALYVALEDEIPIGFIGGQIQPTFFPLSNIKKIGYIAGAYIAGGHRRRGIMKLLEQRLIEFFRKKNVAYVDLNVLNDNITGKSCWKQLGYEIYRLQMRKKIT
jgi:ribosomal protein S18 acetylase RimI-like enzyme